MTTPLYIGIDMGTSGARALVIDDAGEFHGEGKAVLAEYGVQIRNPHIWWQAVTAALQQALATVDRTRITAMAVDGTSGTVLAVTHAGAPIGPACMYNDVCDDAEILARILEHAPENSAAHGTSSALAKAITLQQRDGATQIMHQADWLAMQFSGLAVSDQNNALKTGYDPVAEQWPEWILASGMNMDLLPGVLAPGTCIGSLTPRAAREFALPETVNIVTGTTDGCASFLATGAANTGDAVTALGTTITLKILCDRPIFAPDYGIYSHKILGKWLAGGASNSGGKVLLEHFSIAEINSLSAQIDPTRTVTTRYYPLSTKGERFPVNDPDLAPVLTPRPDDDVSFLHGLFDGMSRIEALGYQQIRSMGGPRLASVRSVGGGASNDQWNAIRQARLDVPFPAAKSNEAAFGAAILAKQGTRR